MASASGVLSTPSKEISHLFFKKLSFGERKRWESMREVCLEVYFGRRVDNRIWGKILLFNKIDKNY